MNKIEKINFIQKEFQKIQNLFLGQKYEKVIEKTLVLVKKDPYQVPFYNYIGLSYRQLGQLDKAEMIFKKGLKLFQNNLSILCNLGALYRLKNQYKDAEFYFQRALDLKNDDFNTICNYANLKRDLNKNSEAINLYEKAHKINDKNETLLLNLAGAYQIDGNFESSKKILRQLHDNFPINTKADYMYSSIHVYELDDPHRKKMLRKLDNLSLSNQDKSNIYFAIAKSYSDIKNYPKSAEFFIKANNTQYSLFANYNFRDEEKVFETLRTNFENTNFSIENNISQPELIFILGMPRSGTTLTHQIISSHSKIYGAGEVPILNNFFLRHILQENFFDKFFENNFDNSFVSEIRQNFLENFRQYSNKIILDKSPLNFRWIGFINILFPNSKIIHCKRNLRDIALSVYKNVFDGGSLPWSYNQENLIQYIKSYRQLMIFWHNKLPNQIYDCNYENLVSDKLNETKKIIKFLNLDWEENCADHTKNVTGIKTVSIAQARRPIYRSSVNLSDNYKESLNFLSKIDE